jgi:chorismate mutase
MSAGKSLDALRREIDRIDDAIHDLIQRRTKVVERVRDLKANDRIKIRPSREDEILYRLMASHRGNFPKRELARIWRELIVATLSFEGPFTAAVYAPDRARSCWDLARDQYGTFTPMTTHPSARRVIQKVRDGDAIVGILPLPRQDDPDPWWPHLMAKEPEGPRIIARLPFAGPGNTRFPDAQALVISPVDRQPTGRERSLIAIEMAEDVGQAKIAAALRDAGLSLVQIIAWRESHGLGLCLYLAEVEGFVVVEDRSLARFNAALGARVIRVARLGGYGTPLTPEDMAVRPEEPAPAATPSQQPSPKPRKRRT